MTDRSTATRPLPRQGPRPLALHLATAMAMWSGSLAALPMSRSGSLPWRPELADEAAALAADLRSVPVETLAATLGREVGRRFDDLIRGILRYREAPPRRVPEPMPEIWREGSSRLLDYGELTGGAAVPVLVVPSLVNRAWVLDLLPEQSFLRGLAELGTRPLLLDWDAPGTEERGFDVSHYVRRLDRVLDAAMAVAGRPVAVIGYCMGGVLATALASRRPGDVSRLALLATPWDFHASRSEAHLLASCLGPLDPLLHAAGELPVDVLQTLFWTVDPQQAVRKFLAFSRLEEGSAAAERFVALEDWVNDGVPLTPEVARDCLGGWYGRNETARGEWVLDGERIDPGRLTGPVLVIVPHRDRIVPPASAEALARAIPDSEILRPAAGHIGMVVGGRSRREVAVPLSEWLTRAD